MKTAEQIIDDIVRREGAKYTNHPADRGGPTRWGITQETLAEWRGHEVTPADVATLPESEAREIYRTRYIYKPGFFRITNEAIRSLVVDSGVQHGQPTAAMWIQKESGVKIDGLFGPVSAAAANAMEARMLFARLLAVRCSFYGRLITGDPERVKAQDAGFRLQAENAAGWSNRLSEFIAQTAVI